MASARGLIWLQYARNTVVRDPSHDIRSLAPMRKYLPGNSPSGTAMATEAANLFSARSTYSGIARNRIGRADLVAQTVGALTPGLSALGTGHLLPDLVGPGFWLSTIGGFGVAFLLSMAYEEFSSRFSAAGSLYTYTAKGFGPVVALMVCIALILSYAAQVSFGLSGAAERAAAAWVAAGGAPLDGITMVAVIIAAACGCLAILLRGIRWSTRSVLGIEVVTIGFVVAVLTVWTLRYGLPDIAAFSLEGASPANILHGAALVAALTIAFESSAMLGLESYRPLRAVPTSTRFSLWIAAAIFAAANAVGTVGPDEAGLWTYRWFNVGSGVSALDAVLLGTLALSLMGLALAGWTALSRLLFVLSREGVIGRKLGATDNRGVPRLATWVVLPLALATIAMTWAIQGFTSTPNWWALVLTSTPVMFTAYGITALALIPLLHHIDELRLRVVLIAILAATGAFTVATDRLLRLGGWTETGMLAVTIVGGYWWHHRLRTRGKLRGVGEHEAPLKHDVYFSPSSDGDPHGGH